MFLMAQILIPFLLARLLRTWQPVIVQAGAVWWGRLALLSMHLLIVAGTACSRPTHPTSAAMDLWQPLFCVCLAGAITCGLGLVTRWWWSAADALTFTIGSVFMNYGLALACTSRFYPGRSDYLLLAILVTIPAMGWPLLAARLLAPASTKEPASCT
jgi:predicted Na+-dependent transporter